MVPVQLLGYTAAIAAALIFLPQVIQTVKSKDTNSLSLATFILVSISNSLWLSYGIIISDPAIILSQVFLFPMGLTILVYKVIYR